MFDGINFERGKSLFDDEEAYSKFFSVGRSETAEHNIYERAGMSFCQADEKTQKLKKSEENQR